VKLWGGGSKVENTLVFGTGFMEKVKKLLGVFLLLRQKT